MIAGCLDWQANRLVRPKIVLDATAEYFENQDTFGQWIDERCEIGRSHVESNARLMADWGWFARGSGDANRITPRAFADRLRAKGFEPVKNLNTSDGKRGRGFKGLRLRESVDAQDGDDL
jgi:putative DNA primase/helicase